MGFINFPSPTPLFPVLSPLTWSRNKEPSQNTETNVAISGREYQIARQVYPRWLFTLRYGGDSWLRDQTQNTIPQAPLGYTEFTQLSGLFLQCLGSYGEFFYTDPDDSSRLAVPCGVTDGASTTYKLYYTWGTGPFTPALTIPVGGVNTIDVLYLNGIAQNPLSYSLDATATQVVFNSPPSAGLAITIDLHFYFRCRFMEDGNQFEEWSKNLWENKELKIMSVKP